MNVSVKSLESGGVVNVPYPTSLREGVENAVISWKEFCTLPEQVRTSFPYNKNEGMGVGYELKKTPGSTLDLKEDFHFTIGTKEWLKKEAKKMENKSAEKLVIQADKLISLMEPFILEFAESLEKEFSIQGLREEVRDSKDMWFLRFLHYFGGRTPGEEIATSHADKSGFTLHLYESDPGLQHLSFNKKWEDMPVSASETAIIPGMRMQYRSNNKLKAVFHRVIATEKTAETGRYSIVCFVHLKRTPQYNKEKAGRLQEFTPGFNYEMSFSEFSKLFI